MESLESSESDKSILFIKLEDDEKREIRYVYHISDIHIRNTQRHEEYQQIFNRVYSKLRSNIGDENKYSLIVITGDIMHTKTKLSPEAFQMAHQFLKTLNEIATVIVIPGNHDCNLSNRDRLDALTPIIQDNTGLDRLYYLKESGIYQYYNIVFGVTSIYGNKIVKASKISSIIWKNIKQKNKYKIALYHGPVHGAKTDVGFRMNNDQFLVEDFQGYTYVMLGDIHRHQFLNEQKTIAYAGSLVQQSYGESLKGHGILKWNLEENSNEFIEIRNDYGYCTVRIENNELIDTFIPKKPRIRFILENTNTMAFQEIVKTLEKKYSICEIVQNSNFKTQNCSPQRKMKKMASCDSQEEIIRNFLSKQQNDNKQIESIIELHKNIYQEILKDKKDSVADPMHNSRKNQKWSLIELQFSNTFSYGENNIIDFTIYDSNKIIGIMAPNHYGKSAILDIILFCLFDKCSRGDRRDIMNKNEKTMYCSLLFRVGTQKYLIERIGNRNRNGLTVKIDVNFYSFRTNSKGKEIRDKLNGIDKNETNRKIAAIVGDYTDYLITCFSLQSGKSANFIDMTQLQKKEYLNQILKLNVFEDCHSYARKKLKELSMELKIIEESNVKNLDELKEKVKKLDVKINFLRGKLNRLEEIKNLIIEPCLNNELIKYNDLEEYLLNSEKDILNTIDELQNQLTKIPNIENPQVLLDELENKLKKLENKNYIDQNKQLQDLLQQKEFLLKQVVNIPEYESIEEHNKNIKKSSDRISEIDKIIKQDSFVQIDDKIKRIDVIKQKIANLRKKIKPVENDICFRLEEITNKLVKNREIIIRTIDNIQLDDYQRKIINNKISLKKSFNKHLNCSIKKLKQISVKDILIDNVIEDHECWINKTNNWIEKKSRLMEITNTINVNEIIDETEKLNKTKSELMLNQVFLLDNEIYLLKIEELEKELDSLLEYSGTKKELDNLLQEKKLLKEKKKITKRRIEEILQYEEQQKKNKVITNDINEISEKISHLRENLKEKTDAIEEIKKKIKKQQNIVKNDSENRKLREKIKLHLQYLREYYLIYIGFSTKKRINDEWIKIKKEIEKEIGDVSKEYEINKIEKENYLNEIKSYLKYRKEFDEKSKIANDYSIYVKMMDYNGLPYEILKNYLPLIESDVNSVLHAMVDFSIEFMFYDENFIKEQKENQIKTNMGCVDINIRYNNMKPYNVQLASGFEKFIINLAVRMTLCSISLTAKPNFLIIDEGWSCLDSDNLSNISSIMNYIKTQYEHVIIISHLEELKDQVDYTINIEKSNGYSYVKTKKQIRKKKSIQDV